MSAELPLPDLPLSLGPLRPAPPRSRLPWHVRLRDALSAYLPLLLMALLAVATWWLAKHSPRPLATPEDTPVSAEPDYAMTTFAMERFGADGRLRLRVEGDRMRHFPASDRIEIDGARIRAITVDGRVTLAHARQAVGNGDGSELQLLGGAEVSAVDADGSPVLMRGEFLHAFFVTERVRTHRPVLVQRGSTELHAAGLDFDQPARRLVLDGPLRAVLAPRNAAASRR